MESFIIRLFMIEHVTAPLRRMTVVADKLQGKIDITTRRLRALGYTLMMLGGTALVVLGRMMNAYVEVDRKLAEIRKVAGLTTSEMDKIFRVSTIYAKTYGIELMDVLEYMKKFYQAGLNTKEVLDLTNISLQAQISSGADAEQILKMMLSYHKSLGLSAQQLTEVMDALNSVENQTASTMQYLIEVMAQSVGFVKAFRTPIEQFIALAVPLEMVGVRASRVRRYFRNLLVNMPKLEEWGIAVKDAEGNLRPLLEVLKDLHELWGKLNDEQRSQLAIMYAGRYYADAFMNTMAMFDEVLRAYNIALEKNQPMVLETARYLDTFSGSVNRLKQEMKVLTVEFGKSLAPVISYFVDLLSTINALIKRFSVLSKIVVQGLFFMGLTLFGLGALKFFRSIMMGLLPGNLALGWGFAKGYRTGAYKYRGPMPFEAVFGRGTMAYNIVGRTLAILTAEHLKQALAKIWKRIYTPPKVVPLGYGMIDVRPLKIFGLTVARLSLIIGGVIASFYALREVLHHFHYDMMDIISIIKRRLGFEDKRLTRRERVAISRVAGLRALQDMRFWAELRDTMLKQAGRLSAEQMRETMKRYTKEHAVAVTKEYKKMREAGVVVHGDINVSQTFYVEEMDMDEVVKYIAEIYKYLMQEEKFKAPLEEGGYISG